MAGRFGGNPSGNAGQADLDQLLQVPACAVRRQHGQVMEMQVTVAMGISDLGVIDLAEPIVGRDGAGVGENEAAQGVGDGRVFLDAPIVDFQVAVNDFLIIQQSVLGLPYVGVLLAIQDVCLGHVEVAGFGQDFLDAVLDVFNRQGAADNFMFGVGHSSDGQHVQHVRLNIFVHRAEGFADRHDDLVDVEIDDGAVAFDDFVHVGMSSLF